jgi:hypothetical protein
MRQHFRVFLVTFKLDSLATGYDMLDAIVVALGKQIDTKVRWRNHDRLAATFELEMPR